MHDDRPFPPDTREAGYSLVEVLFAAVLLGLMAVGVGQSLSSSTEQSYQRQHRTISQMIAANKAEELAVAGPRAVDEAIGTYTMDSSGALDPDGRYQMTVDTTLACRGGNDMEDNNLAPGPIPDPCPDKNPVLTYEVTVDFGGPGQSLSSEEPALMEVTVGNTGRYTHTFAQP